MVAIVAIGNLGEKSVKIILNSHHLPLDDDFFDFAITLLTPLKKIQTF